MQAKGFGSMSRRAALAAIASASLASSVLAQSSISYNGGSLSQNFDGLPSSGSWSFAGPGPIDVSAAPISAGYAEGWSFAKTSGTLAGAIFKADNGTSNRGAIESYGSTGSTDRALGALLSGSIGGVIGATLINNTGLALTQFTLSYTGEMWRHGGSTSADSLRFSYGVGATDLINSAFISASALDFNGLSTSATAGSLDGNASANRTAITATISGISWTPGQTLVLRWEDFNVAGADDGLAIDDLSFVATGGAKSLTWNPPGTNWNTDPANTNWLDGGAASAFSNNDTVNFTDAGVGSVNVGAGGVSPGNLNVSNTYGTYTFTGGTIGGNGGLTKSGDGTLVLNNTGGNTFAGGPTITGGVVSAGSDAQLGAAGAGLNLGGGTLLMTGGFNSARAVTVANASSSTIDTNGNDAVFAGGLTGGGDFIKRGSGSLTINGTHATTGMTSILGGALVLGQGSGTDSIHTGFGGGDFAGDLVIVNGIRVNFNNGIYGGGGRIIVKSTGATISNTGKAQWGQIENPIILNPDHVAGEFLTTIGGTGGNQLLLNGIISGRSDVNFASSGSAGSGGQGTVLLNAQNTWTGATCFNNGGATTYPPGVIKLGVDNALPTGTAIIANTATAAFNGPGMLDLNGHNQTVASLAVGAGLGTQVFEITNAGSSDSVLTVSGSVTPATAFSGKITDGASARIALVKSGTNTLELTGSNTYTGATVVQGGKLVLSANAWNPVLSSAGGADVQAGRLVFDYAGGSSPQGTVVPLLKSSHDGSNFATGQIRSTTADATKGLGWSDDTAAEALTVAYTWYGDTNLDGHVDVIDLGNLATAWQAGGVWRNGDSNYDGSIDVIDLGLLATNWQAGVGSLLVPGSLVETLAGFGLPAAAAPEPAALGLLAGGLIAIRCRR